MEKSCCCFDLLLSGAVLFGGIVFVLKCLSLLLYILVVGWLHSKKGGILMLLY